MGVENGFVFVHEIGRGRGRERDGVVGEPVFDFLDFLIAAQPALGYDIRRGFGGGSTSSAPVDGAPVGRNHTLPVVQGKMTVNKANGVTLRVLWLEKRLELEEELFTSEASGCKLLVEARVGDVNEREIVIGVDVETHDSGREEDID